MHGDEGAFRKWMQFELGTLHEGLVTQRRLLADLLAEERPSAPSRDGRHPFDRAELRRLAEALPTELRYALRLPVQVYVDSEVEDACYVPEAPSAEALARLGIAAGPADPRGRTWLARALALRAVRDWPTCVQLVYL